MSHLQASSFHGELQALRGELKLVARFDHAWHAKTADGWIVTVTTAPYNGPLAVRLARPSLADLPVEAGTVARWAGERLVIGSVEIDVRHATPWRPPERGAPIDLDALCRDLSVLIACSREADRGGISAHLLADGITSNQMEQRATSAVRALKSATLAGDRPQIARSVHALVGLGPGLTPSGDDLLCGFVTGLAVLAARVSKTRPMAPAAVAEATRAAAHRTTSLGRTLLLSAIGVAPFSRHIGPPVAIEPLLSVLWSLGSPGGLQDLDALLRIGHSSGSDMLAGAAVAVGTVLEGGVRGDATLVSSA